MSSGRSWRATIHFSAEKYSALEKFDRILKRADLHRPRFKVNKFKNQNQKRRY